jgi:hypothetical protein
LPPARPPGILLRMALTRPNVLALWSNVCGALAAAVLTIGTFAGVLAAEPSEESGFGSNPGNLRMFMRSRLSHCRKIATPRAATASLLASLQQARRYQHQVTRSAPRGRVSESTARTSRAEDSAHGLP